MQEIKEKLKRLHNKIKKSFKPFLKFGSAIKLIYLYGSVTKKYKPTSDIDILIVIDNTKQLKESKIKNIEKTAAKITKDFKKMGMDLHIQPLKPLSLWWKILIDGEPWMITSIKNSIVIQDKDNLMKEIKQFIKKKTVYSREERAEKLLERAEKFHSENRDLLLDTISLLSNAATESAQILLLFDNKIIFNKEKILESLKKKYSKEINLGTYQEIIDLEKKARKGTLTEFSGKNLSYYTNKVQNFIEQIEILTLKISEEYIKNEK
ncbi:MAG: nucleotidyltransferase domain-containing protein [Candidatus Woesearchaeota archaeon]